MLVEVFLLTAAICSVVCAASCFYSLSLSGRETRRETNNVNVCESGVSSLSKAGEPVCGVYVVIVIGGVF